MENELIRISEIFISLQGEGRSVGRVSLFIRVQGCPLDCTWCDTKYSVPFEGGEEKSPLELSEIIKKFSEAKGGIVVFTGGEPLFYQDLISKTLEIYSPNHVEFETSGIYVPRGVIRKFKFNVSPKLRNAKLSGGESAYKKIYSNIKEFVNLDSIFKFVISSEGDLEEVLKIQKDYGISKEKIFLMPEGKTLDDILEKSRFILPFCLENGFNYSPRLHIMLGIK